MCGGLRHIGGMTNPLHSALLMVLTTACVASSGGSDVESKVESTDDAPVAGGGGDGSGGEAGRDVPSSQGGAGGGPVGSGGEAPDPGCESYPYSADALYAELVGFAQGTTGGDPAEVYHVTTLSGSGAGSLTAALESTEPHWIVFDVEGTITLPGGEVQVQSNKTIDGRGRNITIAGSFEIRDEKNIIVSDVALTNELAGHCTQAGDVISVRGNGTTPGSFTSRKLWFHHVELFNGGDGLLDLRGASQVTLSWSHLHTHKKAMLMGPNADQSPSSGMRVTMHHNFFDRISLRGPQFRQGWAHYFNNYQFEWYEYGAGGLDGAQFLSENNVYQARPGSYCLASCPDPNPCGDNDFTVSKDALVHAWSDNGDGNVKSVGDLALAGAQLSENNPAMVFDPAVEYSYVAEPATVGLSENIAAQAGPRVHYCQ